MDIPVLYIWNERTQQYEGISAIRGEKGDAGADGYTPVKGVDYYTEEEKTEIVNLILTEFPTWTGGSY